MQLKKRNRKLAASVPCPCGHGHSKAQHHKSAEQISFDKLSRLKNPADPINKTN